MSTWIVPAVVVNVHDGDTLLADLDLGWNITLRSSIRIDGLAAPELSTAEGKASAAFAKSLLAPGAAITVVSKKLLGSREKYGRVLAGVTLPDGRDFAAVMIAAGFAVAWDGTGKQPT